MHSHRVKPCQGHVVSIITFKKSNGYPYGHIRSKPHGYECKEGGGREKEERKKEIDLKLNHWQSKIKFVQIYDFILNP